MGMPNGDLVIKRGNGKKLWNNFAYDPKVDGTRKNPVKGGRAKLYGVFLPNGKFGLATRKKDALDYIKKHGGEVRSVDYAGSPSSWDAPTFYVSSDYVAGDKDAGWRKGKKKNSPHAKRPKLYLGVKGRKGILLNLKNPPTSKSHGKRFTKVYGPFASKKALTDYAKSL